MASRVGANVRLWCPLLAAGPRSRCGLALALPWNCQEVVDGAEVGSQFAADHLITPSKSHTTALPGELVRPVNVRVSDGHRLKPSPLAGRLLVEGRRVASLAPVSEPSTFRHASQLANFVIFPATDTERDQASDQVGAHRRPLLDAVECDQDFTAPWAQQTSRTLVEPLEESLITGGVGPHSNTVRARVA